MLITWGMNNVPVGGLGSEIFGHPIDKHMNKLHIVNSCVPFLIGLCIQKGRYKGRGGEEERTNERYTM
jgi:hypothetical protein